MCGHNTPGACVCARLAATAGLSQILSQAARDASRSDSERQCGAVGHFVAASAQRRGASSQDVERTVCGGPETGGRALYNALVGADEQPWPLPRRSSCVVAQLRTCAGISRERIGTPRGKPNAPDRCAAHKHGRYSDAAAPSCQGHVETCASGRPQTSRREAERKRPPGTRGCRLACGRPPRRVVVPHGAQPFTAAGQTSSRRSTPAQGGR